MSDDVHEHESPIKTPGQLITVVVLSFVVPIALIVILTQLVTTGPKADPNALNADAIAQRLKPAAAVTLIDASAPKVLRGGEEVAKGACVACHATGAAGAPKIGDKAAWAARLGQGLDGLVKSAIKGKNAMPARGGNPDIADIELARAIVWMTNQSGASFKEPAAPAAAAADAKAAAAKK
jgi:cytochrome c5